MKINSKYSFQLVKDARTLASVGISTPLASTLVITLVVLTYLGYLPNKTYPISASSFTAILIVGVLLASLRRKKEPVLETFISDEDNNVEVVTCKEKINNDVVSKISNDSDRIGIISTKTESRAIAKKIISNDHEIYFLGIFEGTGDEEEIQSLTNQIQDRVHNELCGCNIENTTEVDNKLKKIFNPDDLKIGDGVSASVTLIIDKQVYNLSIGVGGPHIVLISLHNDNEADGCFEVSCSDINRKFQYYLTDFGRLETRFEDKKVEEITEAALQPRIRHLTKDVPYRGDTIILQPTGYREGDVLILGCRNFWKSCGLQSCYQKIKASDANGQNAQNMADSLSAEEDHRQTIIVFKL